MRRPRYTCLLCGKRRPYVRLTAIFAKVDGQTQSVLKLVCLRCIREGGKVTIPIDSLFPGAKEVEFIR